MSKPKGYNVQALTCGLQGLSKEQLVDVLEKLLEKLNIDVWTNVTPDYSEIILTDKEKV